VEVEVTNDAEFREAHSFGVDAILLDNYRPAEVQSALKWLHQQKNGDQVCIEVSGGVHEGNVRDYVIPGVSVISSGSLTHSVQVADLSMRVKWN
jgi:nicotinate-nucleotide pyrophosphorylase (carboxylating)